MKKEITGNKYGRLLVLCRKGYKYGNHKNYICKCNCGKEVEGTYQQLITGNKLSCGCIRKGINKTHNQSGTRIYRTWFQMKRRCNGNDQNYGGRGITYEKKWETFEGFYEDMKEGYSEELTIDRIDVNGNYCKENCRRATHKQQANNKRNNNKITINGITKNIGEWLDYYKLDKNTYHSRIQNGWTIENAIVTTPKRYNKVIKFNGLYKTLTEWSKELGIEYKTLYRRLYIKEYPLEKVFTSEKFDGKTIL